MNNNFHAGYVAIIGRPNVGKSTLLNYLLGKKISITSRKSQTTRHKILGIKTQENSQIIYVDTPGMHAKEIRQLNRYMNRAARRATAEVDVVLFMIDARGWTSADELVLKHLKNLTLPIILVINKIDLLKQRDELLPFISRVTNLFSFAKVVPICAQNGEQVIELENIISQYLPEQPALFPADMQTDRSEHFIITELIREKLMRLLGEELPYSLTVTINAFEEQDNLVKIAAIIWVEKPGQKTIVIGKAGAVLKEVGTKARLDIENHLQKKVFLQLWVKVKKGWQDSTQTLKQFGYD